MQATDSPAGPADNPAPPATRWRSFTSWCADSGIELLVILLWTLLIAAAYLNLSNSVAPRGIEYYTLIQSNHVWTRFAECGICALWNGSLRGGAPAFADPQASLLHPLVIITTLSLGVITGSKVALVIAFFMAGVAQWWLARVLDLGQTARLWTAGIAVAAGFLAGQMSEGLFGMVISTVSCWLVLPPLIMLARTGSRRASVVLGVTLGLALVAGQGYMQFGLGLIVLLAVLLPRPASISWRTLAQRYACALGLAFLLAAPFLIPFLHFLPQFHKNIDPEFKVAQPLTYVLFNLVINNHALYTSQTLGMQPYPFLYANFIGWVPVVLAVVGLGSRADRQIKLFLLLSALIPLWFASGVPLRWLTHQTLIPWLANQSASLRNCSLLAGMAVAPILALAGLGLQRIIDSRMPPLRIISDMRSFTFNPRWLLIIPLVLALLQAQRFSKVWVTTNPYPAQMDAIVQALHTPDIQWINTPIGDNPYEQVALSQRLKLAYGFRAWDWNNRPLPAARLQLSHNQEALELVRLRMVGDVGLYQAPAARAYARLAQPNGAQVDCHASGLDGRIDVQCDSALGGELSLAENNWDGWRGWVDQQPAALSPAMLLAVHVPPGKHTVSFRYWPWDVPLGLLLWMLGLGAALYQWRR